MSTNRLWIVSVVLSLFIVTLPMGMALTILPLIVFAIPVATSDLWEDRPLEPASR